jgi:hypothetical protein
MLSSHIWDFNLVLGETAFCVSSTARRCRQLSRLYDGLVIAKHAASLSK